MLRCIFFGVCITLHILLGLLSIICIVAPIIVLNTLLVLEEDTRDNIVEVLGEGTPMTLIIAGAIALVLIVVSGASHSRKPTLKIDLYDLIFTGAIIVLVIVTITMDGVFMSKFSKSVEHTEEYLDTKVRSYNKDDKATRFVDSLQKKMRCCGVYGVSDYDLRAVPYTCCAMAGSEGEARAAGATYNRMELRSASPCDGCFDKIWVFAERYKIESFLVLVVKIALEMYILGQTVYIVAAKYFKKQVETEEPATAAAAAAKAPAADTAAA